MFEMAIKFCPECESENIIMVRGDNLQWRCIDCGYESPIFPEKDKIDIKNIKKQENKLNKNLKIKNETKKTRHKN